MTKYRKLRILVDLDGICADLHRAWLDAYRAEYGIDVDRATITSWDIHDHVPHGGEIYKYLETPGFYQRLPLIQGAREGLGRLVGAGHHVLICSSAHAHSSVSSDKSRWVNEHLPFIRNKDIIYTYHKEFVKADVLIDDAPHNISKYRAAWPSSFVYGIETPYNIDMRGIATLLAPDYIQTKEAWSAIVDDIMLRSQL